MSHSLSHCQEQNLPGHNAHNSHHATRNLWLSLPALMLAFAIWMLWSVLVVRLPLLGFRFGANQLFWLTALPGLSAALLRSFYPLLLPLLGGRNWLALSTASLLLPLLGIGWLTPNPDTSYPALLALALLCGLAGGNIIASMTYVGAGFPAERQIGALGLHAGLGQFGVVALQILPWLMGLIGLAGVALPAWESALHVCIALVLLASMLNWLGMRDIPAHHTPFAEQASILRRKHSWLLCWLSLGSFGSFIGYAAAFPLLARHLFPELEVLQFAFLGPLAGALAHLAVHQRVQRPARWALAAFLLQILATLGLLTTLPQHGQPGHALEFCIGFILLFAASGIGQAASLHMIPAIFLSQQQRDSHSPTPQSQLAAEQDARSALGFTSAWAALGAFFIPKSYGSAIAMFGNPQAAMWVFIAFYASCAALTWFYYARKHAAVPC